LTLFDNSLSLFMKTTATLRTLLVSALLSLACPLFAQVGHTPYPDAKDEASWPGVGPIRIGSWMEDNRANFWRMREKHQGAVVFVGDSLIGGWKGLPMAFPNILTANRGIGGDTSRGTLFRFQEDVLDLNPRAIVFCVGTNDLSAHGKPDDVVSNISTMIAMARKVNPAMPIVVCTIPPRDVPNAPVKPGALEDLNTRLAGISIGKEKLVVVDLFTALATPEGKPNPAYIGKDGIHILPAGFEKFAALLRPVFESLEVK
jgi:lysophospholipase L1-like esterase